MANFFPDIWNVFHDGSIESIKGQIPGTIEIAVDIEYLRERFSEPGELFLVTLTECQSLTFREKKESEPYTDFDQIAEAYPGILSAEMHGDTCRMFADNGTMDVVAASGSVRLECGRAVDLGELCQVATDYWTEWEENNKALANENKNDSLSNHQDK